MTNIRYPKITGRTPEEKVAQMESYLRQLVDQQLLRTLGAHFRNHQRGAVRGSLPALRSGVDEILGAAGRSKFSC